MSAPGNADVPVGINKNITDEKNLKRADEDVGAPRDVPRSNNRSIT